MTETTAADGYLIAFERGTLDDDAPEIRARLSALKNQSKALRAGKAELPADLTKIGAEIRHILMNQAHNARNTLFEAMIHEITITADDTVRPVFNCYSPDTTKGQPLKDRPLPTVTRTRRFAHCPTMVGDTGIEPVTSSVSTRLPDFSQRTRDFATG